MSDFVRVRTAAGHEATVSRAYAEATGAEVLDSPATNSRGRPLSASRKNGRPQKSRTTVQKEAAKKAVKKAESPAAPNSVGAADLLPEEAAE